MEEKTTEEKIEEAMLQPKVIEVDGQRVENHSASDLVAVDRYLASKKAMRGRRCPLRMTKMAGGGAL